MSIEINDIVQIRINSHHNPKCICDKMVTTQTKDELYIEYDFRETKKGREECVHYFKLENGVWYKLTGGWPSGNHWYEKTENTPEKV